MKKQFKKWMLRIGVTLVVIVGLLLVIVLNPILSYAHKTKIGNHSIFHQTTVDPNLNQRLEEALKLASLSEYFSPDYKLEICLNDGSNYPGFIKTFQGKAFAWGFYNKVVLSGKTNFKENYVELNGYRWNLTQLLAHEMIHCFQFHKLGFWKSNPVAHIPQWKWEGYPEYIARQNSEQKNIRINIERLLGTEKKYNNGWIQFDDGTGTVLSYYNSWILIQYCMDIRKMNFTEILADTTSEENIKMAMMKWRDENQSNGNYKDNAGAKAN